MNKEEQILHNQNIDKIYSANFWEPVDLSAANAVFEKGPRALYIGTGGTLVCSGSDGSGAQFINIPSGTVMPLKVTEIVSGSTTCSDIIALF